MNTSARNRLSSALCVIALAISGCTKPLPSITIQSGTKSVHTQALCWSETDQNKLRDCLTKLATAPALTGKTLSVTSGNSVGISVDPKVAEYGWQALLGGNPIFTTAKTATYYRFKLPITSLDGKSALQIISFGPKETIRGVWLFQIKAD